MNLGHIKYLCWIFSLQGNLARIYYLGNSYEGPENYNFVWPIEQMFKALGWNSAKEDLIAKYQKDSEWCIPRYQHHANHYLGRITRDWESTHIVTLATWIWMPSLQDKLVQWAGFQAISLTLPWWHCGIHHHKHTKHVWEGLCSIPGLSRLPQSKATRPHRSVYGAPFLCGEGRVPRTGCWDHSWLWDDTTQATENSSADGWPCFWGRALLPAQGLVIWSVEPWEKDLWGLSASRVWGMVRTSRCCHLQDNDLPWPAEDALQVCNTDFVLNLKLSTVNLW